MATLSFTAHCHKGHERLEFAGDPKGFERHMRQVHKARAVSYGMPDTPRPGGLPNKYLRPGRVPTTTVGLTAVLAKAAEEYTDHGRPVGWVQAVTDWHTDELVTLEEVRTGDVFRMGRHEYTCHDRDAWLVSGEGVTEPVRPRNIEDRLGKTVIIVKRAA